MAKDMVHIRRKGGHDFSRVPSAQIQRSQFDRSHGVKTTFNADYICPIYLDEVLPGDTHTCKMTGFVRIYSPLKAPIMDNIYLDVHFFFVPNRLIWTSWPAFNGEQADPDSSTDYTIPTLSSYTCFAGDLGNYLGIPVGLASNLTDISALPFRAYNLIYNEWYRDQNLIDSADENYGAGPDSIGAYTLRKRAKKRDYFTSCLPWPQKTDTPVSISLSGTAPVLGLGVTSQSFPSNMATGYESDGTASAYTNSMIPGTTGGTFHVKGTASSGGYPDVQADLTGISAVSVNELRQAFQIQKLLERDARGGTRYIEIIQSHFGVTNPDYRLQRPEYLGGGTAYINVTPVAQTSEDGTTDQGTLRGVGTGVVNGIGFAKSFTEHGYVLGLITARADLTYQQGLHRHWSRSTRYDFFWPSLANLGEQAVLKKELHVMNNANDDDVFGYQERYGEYRYGQNRLSGDFSSDATTSLDLWHLAEDFSTTPSLNQTFIEYNTPMDRIKSVTTSDDFIGDFWFNLKSARPMPVFGVPGLIDHF